MRRINCEVEVKIEELEWKVKPHEMKAQIQGMKSNAYKGTNDWEKTDAIDL